MRRHDWNSRLEPRAGKPARVVLRGGRISNDPDLLDNLQVWVENNYNTQLIHSNIAFPLLKKLVEIGDPIASNVFKEEIAKRFNSNHLAVVLYLLKEKYYEYLNEEEFSSVIRDSEIIELILKKGDIEYDDFNHFFEIFQDRAPLGLQYKFFDRENKLKKFIGELLEEFPITRYYTLEVLYKLYWSDKTLREALIEGVTELFQKASFSLVYDLSNLFWEGIKYLDIIMEYAWNPEFFKRDIPSIQYIFTNLNEGDIYVKRRCVGVLKIIWRYLEYGLWIMEYIRDLYHKNKERVHPYGYTANIGE